MNKRLGLLYHLLSAVMYLFSLLPLKVLYLISGLLYLLIYHVARYRRRLVRKNLCDSFPEKALPEIRQIEKKFYAWFCDYIVETVKLYSMSEKELRCRMTFEGLDTVNRYMKNGESCALYLGHYCNWEWITSLPLYIENGICAQIYHPLENTDMDELLLKLRGRFGARSIEMNETFRTIVSWKRGKQVNIVGYIADQVPGLHNVHCWVDFLHHDTPVFTGAERINVLTGAKVFYGDITRPKRGYYHCKFVELPVPDSGYVKFYFTRTYFKLLENTINRTPQYWLWSHNRWKRTREQFNKEYTEEERRWMLSRL